MLGQTDKQACFQCSDWTFLGIFMGTKDAVDQPLRCLGEMMPVKGLEESYTKAEKQDREGRQSGTWNLIH